MAKDQDDKLRLYRLLSDLHEANHGNITALTAVIEHLDARIARLEQLIVPERTN